MQDEKETRLRRGFRIELKMSADNNHISTSATTERYLRSVPVNFKVFLGSA